ncbi:MAG: pirin family protein [Myxococcota bacterium]
MFIRRADDRGHANHGWLNTHHTFSFASYYDPRFMGFGPLRVINEDRVAPGRGFGAHPHRDMEIISYVVDGALEHRDSMGTGSVIRPGDLQLMSAGSGVVHSEFNASKSDPVHFLQIWVQPRSHGSEPRYEQKSFAEQARGTLKLVVAPDGEDTDALTINQDARLWRGLARSGDTFEQPLQGSHGWLQVVHGAVTVHDQQLAAGDGIAFDPNDAKLLTITSTDDSTEFLLFDMA